MITREEAENKAKLIMKHYGNWMMDLGKYPGSLEDLINEVYDSFEQHIKSLKAQLANTEQLTCESCGWYDEKRCMNPNGIAYNGDNAVYTDDYCKDHTPKDTQ